MFNGKINYKWSFSIAMLNYQRITLKKMIILKVYDIRTKTLSGWWYTYPSEKYESQLGCYSQYMEKIKRCSEPPTSCNFLLIVSSNPIDCPTIRGKWLITMVQITDRICTLIWLKTPLLMYWTSWIHVVMKRSSRIRIRMRMMT